MMDDLLQQGITAYKAGKLEEARKYFISAVKQSPQSELAWGWMYQTSNNDKERIYCLKQMLRINPKNEKTNQLLNQHIQPVSTLIPPPIQTNSPSIATQKCPYCQEIIRAQAPRCTYCGRNLKAEKILPAKKDAKNKKNLVSSIIGIITVIIICSLIYGLTLAAKRGVEAIPTPTRTPEESAWYACTLFVENQLKTSAFDAESYNSNDVLLLENGQYRVDVSYAKLAITYTCILLDHTDGKWELINLAATR